MCDVDTGSEGQDDENKNTGEVSGDGKKNLTIDGNKEEEKEKKMLDKQEKRLKKLQGQKVYLKTLIGIILSVIVVGFIGVYVGAHKTGISWDEIESMDKGEISGDISKEGHLGGEERLILNEYEGEIDKEDFESKITNEDTFYIYFYSPYCKYCDVLGEEILEVFKENKEQLVILNVNQDEEMQESENIEYVPSVAYYEDGKQVEIVSDVSKEELKELIRGDGSDNTEN